VIDRAIDENEREKRAERKLNYHTSDHTVRANSNKLQKVQGQPIGIEQ